MGEESQALIKTMQAGGIGLGVPRRFGKTQMAICYMAVRLMENEDDLEDVLELCGGASRFLANSALDTAAFAKHPPPLLENAEECSPFSPCFDEWIESTETNKIDRKSYKTRLGEKIKIFK